MNPSTSKEQFDSENSIKDHDYVVFKHEPENFRQHLVHLVRQREIGNHLRTSIGARTGFRNVNEFYLSMNMKEIKRIRSTALDMAHPMPKFYSFSPDGKYFVTFDRKTPPEQHVLKIFAYSGVQHTQSRREEPIRASRFLHLIGHINIGANWGSYRTLDPEFNYAYSDDSKSMIIGFLIRDTDRLYAHEEQLRQRENKTKLHRNIIRVMKHHSRHQGLHLHSEDLDEISNRELERQLGGRRFRERPRTGRYIFIGIDLPTGRATSQLIANDAINDVKKSSFVRDRTITIVRQTTQVIDMYALNSAGHFTKIKSFGMYPSYANDVNFPQMWTKVFDKKSFNSPILQKSLAFMYKYDFAGKYEKQVKLIFERQSSLKIESCLQVDDNILAIGFHSANKYNCSADKEEDDDEEEEEDISFLVYFDIKTEHVLNVLPCFSDDLFKFLDPFIDEYFTNTWTNLNPDPMSIHNNQILKDYIKDLREDAKNVYKNTGELNLFKPFYASLLSLRSVRKNMISPFLNQKYFLHEDHFVYEVCDFLNMIHDMPLVIQDRFGNLSLPCRFDSAVTNKHLFTIDYHGIEKQVSIHFHPTDPFAICIHPSGIFIMRPYIDKSGT